MIFPLNGEEEGCLSRRVHAGTPAQPGEIGTADPARWQHVLWFDGQVWSAELLSDQLKWSPSYEELRQHLARWKGDPRSPWWPVQLLQGSVAAITEDELCAVIKELTEGGES